MKIFKITAWFLNRFQPGHFFFSLKLQTRFQPNIRFRFEILTTDDEFPNFPCLKKNKGYGLVVQAKENERQRGYGKVLDMVLSDYGNCELS